MKEMEQVVSIRERERIISDLEDCIDCVHSHGTFDSLGNFLRSTKFSFLLSNSVVVFSTRFSFLLNNSVVVFEKYSISPLTYTLSGQRIGGMYKFILDDTTGSFSFSIIRSNGAIHGNTEIVEDLFLLNDIKDQLSLLVLELKKRYPGYW